MYDYEVHFTGYSKYEAVLTTMPIRADSTHGAVSLAIQLMEKLNNEQLNITWSDFRIYQTTLVYYTGDNNAHE